MSPGPRPGDRPTIVPADRSDPRLATFLAAHLSEMEPTAPPESRHALDLDGLSAPGVRLWTAWSSAHLVGTVALAPLAAGEEELKSMRTDPAARGRGVGRALLEHAVADARARGVRRLMLETGSMPFFAPARTLYERAGFHRRPPFGSYRPDPNSAFYELPLA